MAYVHREKCSPFWSEKFAIIRSIWTWVRQISRPFYGANLTLPKVTAYYQAHAYSIFHHLYYIVLNIISQPYHFLLFKAVYTHYLVKIPLAHKIINPLKAFVYIVSKLLLLLVIPFSRIKMCSLSKPIKPCCQFVFWPFEGDWWKLQQARYKI